MNKQDILKEFKEHAYNVEDQAGNELIVIEQHQFDSLAERLSDGYKEQYEDAVEEIKNLQDENKDLKSEIRELVSEIRHLNHRD